MRKLLVAAAVMATMGMATSAGAADPLATSPELRAYMSLSFGGKPSQFGDTLHYGLRLDQDSRLAARMGRSTALPALAEVDFIAANGFNAARVNGVPFARHVRQLNEDGSETQGGGYNAWDWGLLAVGVVGLGFGIAEVVKTKDSPDPVSTQKTQVVQTPNGPITVITNTVTGTISSTLNALGVPVTVPNLPVGSLCSAVGITCLTGNDAASGYAAVTRDVQREQWLDSGNGHMGDLLPVR